MQIISLPVVVNNEQGFISLICPIGPVMLEI